MAKRAFLVVSLLVVVALSATACYIPGFNNVRGNGDVVEEERNVRDFSAVALGGFGDLHIELGEREELVIVAEENLLRYIETDVRGNTLQIDTRRGVGLTPTEPIEYYLTVTDLTAVDVSGLGHIDIPALDTRSFDVTISGAGDVVIDELNADRLDVVISGLGGLDIDGGFVERQSVDISGSGSYSARRMESLEADVAISGLGSMTIWASEKLDATISGSGSVNYVGRPSINQSVSGLGRVKAESD